MALSPSTIRRRRRSYSARIASTSASAVVSAARAASWAVVGADMIPYWWTLTIPSRIAGRGADVADPPAGHGVGLGEAAHQDRPLAHARQRRASPGGGSRRRRGGRRSRRSRRAGRGGRRSRRARPGPRAAGRRRSGCTGSRGRAPSSRGVMAASTAAGSSAKSSSKRVATWRTVAAGEDDRRDVGDVRRLVEDHLVARVDRGPQGEVDRLRGADGDEDLGRRVVARRRSGARGGRRSPGAARSCRSCWCSGSARARRLAMPASITWAGVAKSGSPTPRLMTSSIVAAMSKKRRIPDGGTARTRAERARARRAGGRRGGVGHRQCPPASAAARWAGVGPAGSAAAASPGGSMPRQGAPAVIAS